MKALLLLVGTALLVSGTLMQDFRPPAATERTLNFITGQPDLSVLFDAFGMYAATGLVLKLAGAGILFSLLIFALNTGGLRHEGGLNVPVMLSLGSGVCFAASSLTAYSARYMEWIWQGLCTRVPANLSGEGSRQLRDGICALGSSATAGVVFLAVSLFLLAAALMVHRRVRAGSASFPVLALFLVRIEGERRAVNSEVIPGFFNTMEWGGVFSVTAFFLLIVVSAAFFWTLAAPRKSSRKARFLAIAIPVAAGLLAAAFRVVSVANIENLRPMLNFTRGVPSPADMHGVYAMAVSSSYFLALALTVIFIFLPIICAVALHSNRPGNDMPVRRSASLSALIPLILLVSVFGIAAVTGLGKNPFDESLRKAAEGIGNDNPKDVQAEAVVLDSPEGFACLKATAHNPHKFYWYQPVMDYLWRYSSAPGAKKFVIDSLFDKSRPLLAAYAAVAVSSGFAMDDGERADTQKVILKHLSQNPVSGASVLEIALANRDMRSDFVLLILKACHGAGLEKLKIHGEGRSPHYWDTPLDLRDGFTITCRQESEPASNQVTARLLWCRPGSFKPSADPRSGRVLLEAGTSRFRNIRNKFGESVPDYNQFIGVLNAMRIGLSKGSGSGEALQVELLVSPLVPSCHVQYFIAACAGAGITEMHVSELK